MNGGYYSIEFDNNLTIISLNTLYFNKELDAGYNGTEAV